MYRRIDIYKCLFACVALATHVQLASAQPDPESAALDEQLKRTELASLTPDDIGKLSAVLSVGRTRGDWLIEQAKKWKLTVTSPTDADIDNGIRPLRKALEAIRTGPEKTDRDRWQTDLASIEADLGKLVKKAISTLLGYMDAAELRAAVKQRREWFKAGDPVASADWIKLWARGLDAATLNIGKKDNPIKLSKNDPVTKVLLALQSDSTPLATILESIEAIDKWIPAADSIESNAKVIALAILGRALGADEEMLNARLSGATKLPTDQKAWSKIAEELKDDKAWRLEALAGMLADIYASPPALQHNQNSTLVTKFRQNFPTVKPVRPVDEAIARLLAGNGGKPGLAPFGTARTYESAGSTYRQNCNGAAASDVFFSNAQKAKAAILGTYREAGGAEIKQVVGSHGGAVVEIVNVGNDNFVACVWNGVAPARSFQFKTPKELFTTIGTQKYHGLLIAPDRGMWPGSGSNADWNNAFKDSKAVWFAIIPSSAALVGENRWDDKVLWRLYVLDNGKFNQPQLAAYSVDSDYEKEARGFAGGKLNGPHLSKLDPITNWATRMSEVSNAGGFPYMIWWRSD